MTDINAILARVEEVERKAPIYSPAECDRNCDDPHCHYAHVGIWSSADPEQHKIDVTTLAADIRSLVAEVARLKRDLENAGISMVVSGGRMAREAESAVQRATAAETLLREARECICILCGPEDDPGNVVPNLFARIDAHLSAHTPEDAA